jgi:hypothetical protein
VSCLQLARFPGLFCYLHLQLHPTSPVTTVPVPRMSAHVSRVAPEASRARQPCDHAAALFQFKYLASRVQQHYLYLFVPFQLAHDCKASINQSITPAS